MLGRFGIACKQALQQAGELRDTKAARMGPAATFRGRSPPVRRRGKRPMVRRNECGRKDLGGQEAVKTGP